MNIRQPPVTKIVLVEIRHMQLETDILFEGSKVSEVLDLK